tara:strand:+ start:554 stop:967 length:414 start_codon:yes stop_codon:yes gene_type:complete
VTSVEEKVICHAAVNPFAPVVSLIERPSVNPRFSFATASRRNAWMAVVSSFAFLGLVMYWPQLTKNRLCDNAIVTSMFAVVALSLITSICVVAFSYRFTVARVFGGISVLMNVGLALLLTLIYWVLNYSGIEFTGPG